VPIIEARENIALRSAEESSPFPSIIPALVANLNIPAAWQAVPGNLLPSPTSFPSRGS
jgi:hypothetical protein